METSFPTPMTARVELLIYQRVTIVNHHIWEKLVLEGFEVFFGFWMFPVAKTHAHAELYYPDIACQPCHIFNTARSVTAYRRETGRSA